MRRWFADNPWAFYMAMSNHLRVNNDTSFLTSRAASARLNLTVEEALEGIVTDFEVQIAVAPVVLQQHTRGLSAASSVLLVVCLPFVQLISRGSDVVAGVPHSRHEPGGLWPRDGRLLADLQARHARLQPRKHREQH